MSRAGWCVLALLAACGGDDASGQMSALTHDAAMPIPEDAPVIEVQASRWAFEPSTIMLQKGVTTVIELRSGDVQHGFNVPGLKLHAEVIPGRATRVIVTANEAGTFLFHCDYYCGSGHEGMEGSIVVE